MKFLLYIYIFIYIYIYIYILPIYYYTNVVIVFAVAVFDSGETCENTLMYQELLVTFILSAVTTILLKSYVIGIQ